MKNDRQCVWGAQVIDGLVLPFSLIYVLIKSRGFYLLMALGRRRPSHRILPPQADGRRID